jgi:hypothetical protein
MLKFLKRKLILSLSLRISLATSLLISLSLNLNNKALSSVPISLDVYAANNSTVQIGQKMRSGNFLYSKDLGYVELYLEPYRSTRVQIFNCTYFKVDNLSRVGHGIILNLSYNDIAFCPYKSSIKITETRKDKNTKTKGIFKGREIVLYGTELYISKSVEDNEILIGVNNGEVNVNYFTNNPINITNGYFIKSKDNKTPSDLILSPLPNLESIGKYNGLNRVCTNQYNTLISTLGKIPKLIYDKKCVDTELTDRMFVINPSGNGTNRLWVFLRK